MPRRWGLGPVFAYESLLNARRWQVYAGRAGFVLILLIGMAMVWITHKPDVWTPTGPMPTYRQMAVIGEKFFYALTGIQIALVLLAAPAATAGAICMDRARGSLLHMMVTDLSDAEIVLGKLAARLAPVFGLIACAVPVAFLAGLLGGIDFIALLGGFVVTAALAVFGCALALTISVWAGRTADVLMAVYLVEGLWLLSVVFWWGLSQSKKLMGPPPDWFQKANPYVLAFGPYNRPGWVALTDYAVFAAAVLGVSALLVGLAVLRLRSATVRQSGRPSRARARRFRLPLPGPTLDGNPVLWREWHRNRPSKLARWLWGGLLLSTWGLAAWGVYDIVTEGVSLGGSMLETAVVLQIAFGMLMLSVLAPMALSEERVRGSLDVLLATPLPTAAIVRAKWLGTFRSVLVLGLLPLLASVLLAASAPAVPYSPPGVRYGTPPVPLTLADRVGMAVLCAGDLLASGAWLVSLGLALATWTPRQGRAIGMSVAAFLAFGVGWLILVPAIVYEMPYLRSNQWLLQNRWFSQCLFALSPLAGAIISLDTPGMLPWLPHRSYYWIGMGVVLAIKVSAAGLLFWATVRLFDRYLGRVSEVRPSRPDPRPLPLEPTPARVA